MIATSPLPEVSEALEILAGRGSLSRELAARVLELVVEGRVGEVQVSAFLMGLRTKGETTDEIVGLAETMRRLAEPVHLDGDVPLVDTCGTGGDRLGTFNISTTAAFVVAGAGARVAKHGNRGVTSGSGSADVLEALGVRIDLAPTAVARCLHETGIGFMFAPLHHKAMRHLVSVRRDLGIRTILNFLGPLTNPAGARRQLIGVSDLRYVTVLAEAAAAMDCEHALVVHGGEGLDELSVTASTTVVEVSEGCAGPSFQVEPGMFGLGRWPLAALAGGTPANNAAIAEAVLRGEPGGALDVVLLNAGAALYVAGVAGSIGEGVVLARESIESGKAWEKLDRLVETSRRLSATET